MPTSVAVVGAQRDADARPELDRDAAERERPPSASSSRPASSTAAPRSGQIGQQHRELVAAEAGQRVGAAHAARRRSATSTSSASPLVVPERVVDLLEAVEVDQQQRGQVIARGPPPRRGS